MWFLNRKKKVSLNSNQEFHAHINSLIERLQGLNLVAPAQELYSILHESACITSSELLGELKLALVRIRTRHREQLPLDVEQDIASSVMAIEDAWNRANGRT
jgi:oligoendopeptidase F